MIKERLSTRQQKILLSRRTEPPPAITPFEQYHRDLSNLDRPLLSAEEEKALAKTMEYGRLANAIFQLDNTNGGVILIRQGHNARILKETAEKFINNLGISEKIETIAEDEPVSKKDPNIVTVAQKLRSKGPIHWSITFTEKLKRLKDEGDKAEEELVESNLKLAYERVPKTFLEKEKSVGFQDLIQEACIGLLKAVRKYEWWRKDSVNGEYLKFSTNATWWIRQSIRRSIQNTATSIRISVAMNDQYSKIQRETATIREQEGQNPTVEEIVKIMGESPKKIADILEAKRISQPDSLDRPLNTDGPIELYLKDTIPSPKEQSPEKIAEDNELQNRVWRQLTQLTFKQQICLRLRIDMRGRKKSTQQEQKRIGDMLGITQQGVSSNGKRAEEQFKKLVQEQDPGLLDFL